MKPKVVNISKLRKNWIFDSDYVYIGRAGKGLPGTFGNPFPLKSEKDRAIMLEQYREYLESRIETDRFFREAVVALKDKILVCFCHPKPCHGDVLAEVVERLNG